MFMLILVHLDYALDKRMLFEIPRGFIRIPIYLGYFDALGHNL